MPTDKIIQEASGKPFCQKVAFVAMKLAHKAGKSDGYAQHIVTGKEKAVMLALHVVAASDKIEAALEEGGAAAVKDADIEAALKEIWEARSAAAGFTPLESKRDDAAEPVA
jgi:hypothetical protein